MLNQTAKVRVAIYGCTGRVGKRLCALISARPDLSLVAAITRNDDELLGKMMREVEPSLPQDCKIIVSATDLAELPTKPDIIVDFSAPTGTMSCINQAAKLGIPVVTGTTGLSADQMRQIESASLHIPVIHAMNFSLGVNLLVQVVATVARALDEEFNVEIIEAHHNKKVDAPSGTALALADSVCQASNRSRSDLVHGRLGQVGQRTVREIGMHSMRMGSVIGDHTVHFGNEFERLEFTHRAQDRDVFASGALKAAQWLIGQRPGLYTMADVLFKNSSDKRTEATN